jgi:UPF0755 protein
MNRVYGIVGVILLAAILSFAGLGYWLHASLNSPKQHDLSGEYIVIERGTPPSAVIDLLAQRGIIGSALPVKIYLRTFGSPDKLKAGEYRFESPISAMDVLAALEKGEERSIKFVIPEGFTRFDIARRIREQLPLAAEMSVPQILLLMEDTAAVQDIAPEAQNLEGYMYPSTYNISPLAKPEDVIAMSVQQFRKIWKPEWSDAARLVGRTPHQIVTIASLIETETSVEFERPVVASVIYNRLSRNIPLGIDQTAVYIAKMQNRWDGTIHKSDLEADSPYNTRRYGGIPPGPISSVSESSIRAALTPVNTEFLYYVRNVQANDGSHWFYRSAADFERGKAEYQRWLEKERREMRGAEEPRR